MKINGIIKKVGDYLFDTGEISFTLLDEKGNQIDCKGSAARFQAGYPVVISGQLNTNIFMFNSIKFDYDNIEAVKSLIGTTEYLKNFTADDMKSVSKDHIKKIYSVQFEQNFHDKYGLEYTQARKLVIRGVYDIPQNPYKYMEIYGFEKADALALQKGLSSTDKIRLDGILNAVLDKTAENGSSILTWKELSKTLGFMKMAYSKLDAQYLFYTGKASKKYKLVEEGYAVMARILAEKNVARQLARIAKTSFLLPFDYELVDKKEIESGFKYGDNQREAFAACSSTGIKILRGGPGTGKTTTLKGIIEVLEELFFSKFHKDPEIKCCAPTGRAAQRMKESTGLPSQTVHKLCEYSPFGESYTSKNEENPIEADIIIADESSMIDIETASMLLSAVKDGTFLLFVGDTDQLESVGPGAFLRDLVESGLFEIYNLNKIYRQAEGSEIVANAYRTKNGDVNIKEADDFHIIREISENDVRDKTHNLFINLYRKEHPFDVQILSPVKKGSAGVINLNNMAQDYVMDGDYVASGSKKFYVGDKIIFTSNNYSEGYFNGDTGIVEEIRRDSITVDVMGMLYKISKEDFDSIMLAYDITIHKSQGSEYPVIIIPLTLRTPSMLNKNLLYTAITRAKKVVYILSEQDALERCILGKTKKRYTKLVDEIKKCFC